MAKKKQAKPAEDLGRLLPLMAVAAADKARKRKEPLSRSEALAAAPWDGSFPPAWETAFREAYANRLQELGGATVRRPTGSTGSRGKLLLSRRLLSATKAEFAEQDAIAAAAGLSWSSWARRKLSQ
jgi:hypothetical protein